MKGYPRDPTYLPCICILLSNEDETQEGLGDYGDSIDTDIREYTEEVEVVDSPSGKFAVPYARLTHSALVSVSKVVHNSLGIELDGSEYGVLDYDLGFIELPSGDVEHGDTLTVTYTYKFVSQEYSRTLFESNFRLETWADNGDLVVEIYSLLKWALLSGRDHLGDDRDIFNQRISGADFEPAPNFFPEFVYRRALNFWCQFNISTPTEESGYIDRVEVNPDYYSDSFYGGEE